MTGHALPQVTEALAAQAARGITTMLPSPDAAWVADELARRFGLPAWQLAMSATDANRFVLRFARHLTGRPRIAVMDWCYHGTVDETLAVLDGDRVVPRPGALGPQVAVAETTAVVPFNDVDALDRRLAQGDVACLLMEPALTNIGIVLPDDRLPRRGAGDHPPPRGAAGDRRDPHVVRRPRRRDRGLGSRARPAGRRQADRRRRPGGGVRHVGRGRRPAVGADEGPRDRRRRRRRHPHRQRAGARGRARDAVVLPARGGLRRGGPARRAVHDGRGRGDRPARAAVARAAAGLPGGVLVLPTAAGRRRGGRRRRRGPRGLPAPVVPQPGRAADAVPQHGAVQPAPHRRPTSTGTPRSSARPSPRWSGRPPEDPTGR